MRYGQPFHRRQRSEEQEVVTMARRKVTAVPVPVLVLALALALVLVPGHAHEPFLGSSDPPTAVSPVPPNRRAPPSHLLRRLL